ncbi:MAG: copper resistance protein CopC, partial [Chloroflexia bacterium]
MIQRSISKRMWGIMAVVALLVSVIGTPGVSWAHARIATANPANGATVQPGLGELIINYTEDVSVDQSTAVVNMTDGTLVASTASIDRANRKKMTIKMASPLKSGTYVIKWHTVTEDDNGIADGTLNFTVAGTPAPKCVTFDQTKRSACGRFLEYWNANGGLAQQGYPISAEMQEKSDTDGKTYTVQYFERAVFEKHPEN